MILVRLSAIQAGLQIESNEFIFISVDYNYWAANDHECVK